mmetsp:Transcript_54046/g.156056  ORF Transcript_54046/g.156056 Transcript_54046/m.156056 type:complete len:201 (+) Transcript_54046:293-895(+)
MEAPASSGARARAPRTAWIRREHFRSHPKPLAMATRGLSAGGQWDSTAVAVLLLCVAAARVLVAVLAFVFVAGGGACWNHRHVQAQLRRHVIALLDTHGRALEGDILEERAEPNLGVFHPLRDAGPPDVVQMLSILVEADVLLQALRIAMVHVHGDEQAAGLPARPLSGGSTPGAVHAPVHAEIALLLDEADVDDPVHEP